MKKLSSKEKELNKKITEVFLYEYGQEYTEIICNEMDELRSIHKGIEVPESLDKWFENYAQKENRKKNVISILSGKNIIVKRIAVFLIAFIAISASLMLGVEAFRIKVFNFVLTDNTKYTDISVIEELDDQLTFPAGDWKDYYPTYLPDNYILIDYINTEGYKEAHFSYNGDIISFYLQGGSDDYISYIDTEGVIIEYTEVNMSDAIYVNKAGNSIIAWSIDDTLLKVIGPIDLEEVLKIAESIKKVE